LEFRPAFQHQHDQATAKIFDDTNANCRSKVVLTEFQNFQNFSISIIPRFTIPIPLFSYSLNIGSSSSKVILKILKFCQNGLHQSGQTVPLGLPDGAEHSPTPALPSDHVHRIVIP